MLTRPAIPGCFVSRTAAGGKRETWWLLKQFKLLCSRPATVDTYLIKLTYNGPSNTFFDRLGRGDRVFAPPPLGGRTPSHQETFSKELGYEARKPDPLDM